MKKSKRSIKVNDVVVEEPKPIKIKHDLIEDDETAKESRLQVVIVNCRSVNVREKPDPNSKVRFIATAGNKFYLIKTVDGWSMIESDVVDKFGFIRNEFVEQVSNGQNTG